MSKFSIIIPVYNVEKYINQCVDSILQQRLDNIEIILVDDGSKDKSPLICDEYAKNYEFIKVIHKDNGGQSSARNAGIATSCGDYIMFLDSDDWWNPEVNVKKMLEYVAVHNDVDVFLFDSLDYCDQAYFKRNDHDNFCRINKESVDEFYQSLIDNGNFEMHAATKILKAEVIKEHNLLFKEGYTGEDNEWMMRLLRVIKKVDIINEPLYIYRCDREGSITNTITSKNIKDMLSIVQSSIDFYATTDIIEVLKLKEKELSFASYLWFTSLGLVYGLDNADKKMLKPLFKSTKIVCQYSTSKKTKLCNFVYKIMGYGITIRILGCYIKLKKKFMLSRTKVS